jgi:hypothetical protein
VALEWVCADERSIYNSPALGIRVSAGGCKILKFKGHNFHPVNWQSETHSSTGDSFVLFATRKDFIITFYLQKTGI